MDMRLVVVADIGAARTGADLQGSRRPHRFVGMSARLASHSRQASS